MSEQQATASERCENCGDPPDDEGDFGTEADGSRSEQYCRLCYRDGQFLDSMPGRGDALHPR